MYDEFNERRYQWYIHVRTYLRIEINKQTKRERQIKMSFIQQILWKFSQLLSALSLGGSQGATTSRLMTL